MSDRFRQIFWHIPQLFLKYDDVGRTAKQKWKKMRNRSQTDQESEGMPGQKWKLLSGLVSNKALEVRETEYWIRRGT